MIHINLNMIFYTQVEHSPTKTIYIKIILLTRIMTTTTTQNLTKTSKCNLPDPGTFEFPEPSVIVKESVGMVQIPVSRTDGADGRVELAWEAKNMTAVYGKDYDKNKGTLVFEHGQLSKTIDIGIIDDQVSWAGAECGLETLCWGAW